MTRLLTAAAVVLALLLGACGDDDTSRTAPSSTSSTSRDTSVGETTGPPTGGAAYVVDEAVLRPAVDQAEKIFNGVDGVDDDDYRAVFGRACEEVRSGVADGRDAEDTARAIADAIPDGPTDRKWTPAALLATEVYLTGTSCGIDPAYPASVREALHPIANQAFLDATRG